jgi:hypothetical protein
MLLFQARRLSPRIAALIERRRGGPERNIRQDPE